MSSADRWKQGGKRGGKAAAPAEQFLLKIVDGGLAGCIFIVPLLMGGRQALGQLVLVSLAVVVGLAWTLHQCLRARPSWRRSPATLLLLAGIALVALQLAPLPQTMLTWLAPHTAKILPLWTATDETSTSLGAWSCISMTPAATRAALTLLLAYGLLFLVTVQRIRKVEDVERLLRWIAISALMMAGFGLVQLLTGNGKFFWFYEHPFSDTSEAAKGSFTNRNHFAHFLALGIGPLIWWLQANLARPGGRRRRSRARDQSVAGFQSPRQISSLRTVGLGIVLFAGLMSLSRGGMLVMFIAVAISVAFCYRAKTLGSRFVLSMGAVALLIGALLTIHGSAEVGGRLEELSSASIETLDQKGGRRIIWATVAKAIPDYALLGSGVGSHREVYPMYLDKPVATEYTHAENCPLQVLLETGAVGLTLVLAGIGFCGFWCISGLRKTRSKRQFVCIGAISASLVVSIAHSLADFVWYVPACMALVAVLAGCACRTWQLATGGKKNRTRSLPLPKSLGVAMAVGISVVGTWMIAGRVGPTLAEPHWDRYRIMAMASARPAVASEDEQTVGAPQQDHQVSLEAINRMIDELEQVVRWDPAHARARLRLAEAYLCRFDISQREAENPLPLAQIRDAVFQARAAARDQQTSREVEEWLARTISGQEIYIRSALQHTRRGLELCPLQGEGYLRLAELSFLGKTSSADIGSMYVDQALRVRPLDGAVLFEAGREAWLSGNYQQGVEFWRRSFHCGRKYQKQLIDMLVGRVPVAFILKGFQPDLIALRMLHAQCGRFHLPDQIGQLRYHYARAAENEARLQEGKTAAYAWLEAGWLYHLLSESDRSYQCAQNAFQCDPNNFDVRYALAIRMAEQKQFAASEKHLDWCLQRRPDDQRLQNVMRRVVVGKIDSETGPRMATLSQSLPQ